MDKKKVLSDVADTVLDTPLKFTVDVKCKHWLDKVLKKKDQREFSISGLTLGSLVKISKELLLIDPKKVWDKDNVLNTNYHLIEQHGYRMAVIVAIAVENKKGEVNESLVNFFLNNLTAKELYSLVNIILNQMDVVSFLKSIVSVSGLQMISSPKTEEIIASGQPLED